MFSYGSFKIFKDTPTDLWKFLRTLILENTCEHVKRFQCLWFLKLFLHRILHLLVFALQELTFPSSHSAHSSPQTVFLHYQLLPFKLLLIFCLPIVIVEMPRLLQLSLKCEINSHSSLVIIPTFNIIHAKKLTLLSLFHRTHIFFLEICS